MPARNASLYLDEAVESILQQTFEDFEFVIRDDGSTDDTFERMQVWARRDRRVRIFRGETLGVVGSSNWVVSKARAPIIARMDADDVAAPERLERQLALLRTDRETVMATSLCRIVDASGEPVREPDYWRLVRRSRFMPFPHTSIMFRRAAFDRIGGYRDACPYWEDLDLCLRIQAIGQVAVIADALVTYRVSPGSVRLSPEKQEQIEAAVDAMYETVDGRGRARMPGSDSGARGLGRTLRPMALVSINSGLLWCGGHPRILRHMIARCRLRGDFETLYAFGWALFAQTSPPLLRFLLRCVLVARNARARFQVRRGGVYLWRPGRPAISAMTAATCSRAYQSSGRQSRVLGSLRTASRSTAQ